MNRRNFLKGLGLAGAAATVPNVAIAGAVGYAIIDKNGSINLTRGHPTYDFPVKFENGIMRMQAAEFKPRKDGKYDLLWVESPYF